MSLLNPVDNGFVKLGSRHVMDDIKLEEEYPERSDRNYAENPRPSTSSYRLVRPPAIGEFARRSQARVTIGSSVKIEEELLKQEEVPTKIEQEVLNCSFLDTVATTCHSTIPTYIHLTENSKFVLSEYHTQRNVFKLIRECRLDPYTAGIYDSSFTPIEDPVSFNQRQFVVSNNRFSPISGSQSMTKSVMGSNYGNSTTQIQIYPKPPPVLPKYTTYPRSDIQFYFKLIKNNTRVFGDCESNMVRKIVDWNAFTLQQESERYTDADVCNWFFQEVVSKETPTKEVENHNDEIKSLLDLPNLSESRSVGKGTIYQQMHGNTLEQAEELNHRVQLQRLTTMQLLKDAGHSEFDGDETKTLLSLLLRDTSSSHFGSYMPDASKENSVMQERANKKPTETPVSKVSAEELDINNPMRRKNKKKELQASKSEIYRHVLTDNLNPGTRYLDCFVCGCIVEMTQILDYIKHIKAHRLPPLAPYPCTQCKEVFGEQDALLHHLRFHHLYD